MKILGTGLNGLIGSRIVELLHDTYEFESLSRSTGVDLTNRETVLKAISDSNASYVIHLAAKTDVDGCEREKELAEKSEAWQINVEGTKNILQACEKAGKKLIFISTDFVFDGTQDMYSEDDTPHPINWYAQTKYEGEKLVTASSIPWIIARLSFPYRAQFSKKDFFRAIKERLENGQTVSAISDQIFTPTFIDDIAGALNTLIQTNSEGIYHVVGSESLTPDAAALKIAEVFGLQKRLISKISAKEFFAGRAARPFRLAVNSDKIGKIGVRMTSFSQGLEAVKRQLT